ncbi:TlpA family protein disulfide reductase [Sorangium sp. So ce1000]|uniref:TlpA family protein disulfide reductase n=1 Tax=Sorangium sp. So ce1000 TaxID=3133325 RepID=UPI003F5DB0B5
MRSAIALSSALGVVACCGWLVACGGVQPAPEGARTTVVSLRKIDCVACGAELVADLRERPGVHSATFDRRRAEISVTASRSFDVEGTVKRLAANEGFEAVLGAGKGQYTGWATFPEGADARTIELGGADIPDLGAQIVPGKVTVIDFVAGWCMACRTLDAHMATVLEARKDVAYRKLDVVDWDSPLAQRYLKQVSKLPYVIVFDATGARVEALAGPAPGEVDAAIERAARR